MEAMNRRSQRLVLLVIGTMTLGIAGGAALAEEKQKPEKRAASHLKLAQKLYESGRYAEALGAVEKSIKEHSRYAPSHQLRGQILFAMDAMEEALKEFEKTLSLERTYTEARNWKGWALVQLKRNDEAMREYEAALTDLTYPTPEKIHLNIGMLHRLEGRNPAAIESLTKAVRVNPSYGRGYYELGVTYEKMGKSQEALRAYQDALVGMDNSADLNLRLGLALVQSGNTPRARQHFEKVIKLAPDGPEAAQARDQIKKLQPPS